MNYEDDEEIKRQFEALITENALPSKIKRVRKFMPLIESALNAGVAIEHITTLLNKMEIPITKSYLNNSLYRIRKERKSSKSITTKSNEVATTKKAEKTPQTNSRLPSNLVASQEEFEELTKKLDAFDCAAGWEERYVALGGDIEEICSKPASQKRLMAMGLKSQIEARLSVYK